MGGGPACAPSSHGTPGSWLFGIHAMPTITNRAEGRPSQDNIARLSVNAPSAANRQTQSGPSARACAYISCGAAPPMTDNIFSSSESGPETSRASLGDGTRPSVSRASDAGEVCFVTAERRQELCLELEDAGLLIVHLDDIAASVRGRLGEALDAAGSAAASPGDTKWAKCAGLCLHLWRSRAP